MPALAAEVTQVETVRFTDPRLPTVRVVRGPVPAAATPRLVVAIPPASITPAPTMASAPALPRPQFRPTLANTEIISFGDGRATTVTVVRGSAPIPAAEANAPTPAHPWAEAVRSAASRMPRIVILRGDSPREVARAAAVELFSAASAGELDRVAFAVDGAESGHGANLAMWRPAPDGPQGPMQISAAAALDVGGGNRFDEHQNRLLGRAYLARLYSRYGNWPDAVAAYNWGPGNLDGWIAAGRQADRLPLETARYLNLVLRDAFLIGTARR
jgi:hypothetical protein